MAVSKVPATLPFDEIVPGALVRFCVIDGVQYLSIRDMIMCVCGKNNDEAGLVWRRMTPERLSEIRSYCSNFKFPGRGAGEQPVITFVGALKLIMMLPGEAAKTHRSAMADILRRYYAGDVSLIDDLEANALSESPVAQMARASLAAEGGAGEIEDSRKRKREELELRKMEAEIQCMERNCQVAILDRYTALCTNTEIDERAKLIFKDAILNAVMVGRAITNGVPNSVQPISISQVAADIGVQVDSKAVMQIGRIASKLYKDKHGETPAKHTQLVNGQAVPVNNYFESDRELVESAIRDHVEREAQASRAAAGSRKLDQWLAPRT